MSSLQTKRWTRAEYDRLIDLGVFGPEDPYSSDLWLFKQALADGIGALRKSPPAG